MSEEFRRAKRRRALETIEVFDTMAETIIGRIGNVSESGMMVLAAQSLTDDALYQLRFNVNSGPGRAQRIDVGAHQLWLEDASSTGQHWCGFRFIDISPEHLEALRAWIESPGGQYA
jgi:c-di-GMP-binding flagellar brake protein YcgR